MSLVYWTGRLKTTSDVLLTSITQNVTTGTSGTHTDLSTTTNGEGSGAVLTVTISSGSIVSVTVTDSGKRYNAGDTLTVNSIPGSFYPSIRRYARIVTSCSFVMVQFCRFRWSITV